MKIFVILACFICIAESAIIYRFKRPEKDVICKPDFSGLTCEQIIVITKLTKVIFSKNANPQLPSDPTTIEDTSSYDAHIKLQNSIHITEELLAIIEELMKIEHFDIENNVVRPNSNNSDSNKPHSNLFTTENPISNKKHPKEITTKDNSSESTNEPEFIKVTIFSDTNDIKTEEIIEDQPIPNEDQPTSSEETNDDQPISSEETNDDHELFADPFEILQSNEETPDKLFTVPNTVHGVPTTEDQHKSKEDQLSSSDETNDDHELSAEIVEILPSNEKTTEGNLEPVKNYDVGVQTNEKHVSREETSDDPSNEDTTEGNLEPVTSNDLGVRKNEDQPKPNGETAEIVQTKEDQLTSNDDHELSAEIVEPLHSNKKTGDQLDTFTNDPGDVQTKDEHVSSEKSNDNPELNEETVEELHSNEETPEGKPEEINSVIPSKTKPQRNEDSDELFTEINDNRQTNDEPTEETVEKPQSNENLNELFTEINDTEQTNDNKPEPTEETDKNSNELFTEIYDNEQTNDNKPEPKEETDKKPQTNDDSHELFTEINDTEQINDNKPEPKEETDKKPQTNDDSHEWFTEINYNEQTNDNKPEPKEDTKIPTNSNPLQDDSPKKHNTITQSISLTISDSKETIHENLLEEILPPMLKKPKKILPKENSKKLNLCSLGSILSQGCINSLESKEITEVKKLWDLLKLFMAHKKHCKHHKEPILIKVRTPKNV